MSTEAVLRSNLLNAGKPFGGGSSAFSAPIGGFYVFALGKPVKGAPNIQKRRKLTTQEERPNQYENRHGNMLYSELAVLFPYSAGRDYCHRSLHLSVEDGQAEVTWVAD